MVSCSLTDVIPSCKCVTWMGFVLLSLCRLFLPLPCVCSVMCLAVDPRISSYLFFFFLLSLLQHPAEHSATEGQIAWDHLQFCVCVCVKKLHFIEQLLCRSFRLQEILSLQSWKTNVPNIVPIKITGASSNILLHTFVNILEMLEGKVVTAAFFFLEIFAIELKCFFFKSTFR